MLTWRIQPSEFWRMSMPEIWVLCDQPRAEKRYGKLTEGEAADLYDLLKASQRRAEGAA